MLSQKENGQKWNSFSGSVALAHYSFHFPGIMQHAVEFSLQPGRRASGFREELLDSIFCFGRRLTAVPKIWRTLPANVEKMKKE